MPGTERINSIYDIASLQKEQRTVIEGLTASKKAILDLYTAIQQFKGSNFATLAQNTDALTKATLAANKATSQALDIAKKQEQLKQQQIRTQQAVIDLTKKQSLEEDRQKKAAAAAAKAIADKNNLYKQLSATLKQQEIIYTNLALSEGRHTAASKAALANVTQTRSSLNALDSDLTNHQRNVGNYASAFQNVGNVLKNLAAAAGVTLGLGAIVAFFKGAAAEASQAEAASSRLKNILENVGRIDAFDRLKAKAGELAKAFQYLKSEDVIEVFQKLITYGKLTEDQINQLTPVIINFAAKQNISLAESTDVVTKALEGNSRSLKEYGISVKDGKNVTERFGIIMDELKPRVDGAAIAFGKTFAGQLAISKQKLADLEKEVGEKTIPILIKLLGFAGKVTSAFGSFGKLVGDIGKYGNSGIAKFNQQADKNQQKSSNEIAAASVITRVEDSDVKAQKTFLDSLNKSIIKYGTFLDDAKARKSTEEIKNYTNALKIAVIARDKLQDIISSKEGGVLGSGDPNKIEGADNSEAEAKKKADALKKALEEELALKAQRAQFNADRLKDLGDNENVLLAVRIFALKKYAELEGEILTQAAENEIRINQTSAVESIRIREKAAHDVAKLEAGTVDAIAKLNAAAQKTADEAKIKQVEETEDKIGRIGDAALANLKANREKEKEEDKKAADAKIALAKQVADAEKNLAEEAFTFIQTLVDARYENRINQIQSQIDLNDKLYSQEILNVQNSSLTEEQKTQKTIQLQAQQAAKNTQLNQKINHEKEKQAKFDRDAQILKIIGEAIAAHFKIIAELGPAGIPLAIINDLTAGIEVATLLAKPLPKYSEGLSGNKGAHVGIYGEAGAELIEKPGQAAFVSDKATIDFLPAGTRIKPLTGDVVNEMMQRQLLRGMMVVGGKDESIELQRKMLKAMRRKSVIKNNVNVDMREAVWKYLNIYRG